MGLRLRMKTWAAHLCIASFPRRVPILAFFGTACPEHAEGVGGDAACATFVRSTLPVVAAVVVPAPSTALCRKSPLLAQTTREKWGTRDFHFRWWAKGPWALRAGSSQSTRSMGHPPIRANGAP